VRFCGLLPVQVLFLPGQPARQLSAPTARAWPTSCRWAGEAIRAELPLSGTAAATVCRYRIDRLLQFYLGLEDVGPVRSTRP